MKKILAAAVAAGAISAAAQGAVVISASAVPFVDISVSGTSIGAIADDSEFNITGAQLNATAFTGNGVAGYFQLEKDKTYIVVDRYSPKEFSGWVNGAVALDKTAADWQPEEALPNMYIGGTGTSYNEFWNGDIAEVIVYARKLTDDERKQVEDTLAKKYGVTIIRTQ